MLYRPHLRPPFSNNLSRAFGLTLSLSLHLSFFRDISDEEAGERILLHEKEREGRRGRRERKRPVGAVCARDKEPKEKRTECSPRCTSVHRRTEGHEVYFCRMAAAVAGQKACGFHPGLPRVSITRVSLSFSPSAFSRTSLSVPHSRSLVRSGLPPSSPPFLHGGPARSFFSSRYASFYATAQLRSVLVSHPQFSLPLPSSNGCSLLVSFSPFLHRSSSASLVLELNHLPSRRRRFFADTPYLSS